jgi:hypothetical protein
MDEIDRHAEVMGAIGTLNGNVEGINGRLDKINGSLLEHAKDIFALNMELVTHAKECPALERVNDISHQLRIDERAAVSRDDKQIAVANARAKANERWRQVLMPIVYILAGSIVTTFAPKLAEWLKVVLK